MSWVLELGVMETVEGGAKVWRSNGFYADWSSHSGNVISPGVDRAHRFPDRDHALNVQRADDRLKAGRVVEVD